MLEVFAKSLQEITADDIRALIELAVPEGDRIEFKKELPGQGGRPDPWMEGGKVGSPAKDRILKEVVAFANAYGGVLVIGIDEDRSGEESAVASEIMPVPRCKALAKSLELVFRDRVEPQLARVEIAGIPIEEDGAGVVVIRVGKSRLAPQRNPPGFPPSYWRPLLRGARAVYQVPEKGRLPFYQPYREIYCDGMMEFGLVSIADDAYHLFDPDWPIVLLANLALWADHVRRREEVPSLEYAVQVEICILGNGGLTSRPDVLHWRLAPPRLVNTAFPVYPLNESEEIVSLLVRFYRDFWNSMGRDGGEADFCLR